MSDEVNDELYDDPCLEEDDDAEDEANCGQTPDGLCQLAGTEYCDWSCPFSDELRANRLKKMRADPRQGDFLS